MFCWLPDWTVTMPNRDIQLMAADGYALQATLFSPEAHSDASTIGVVINSATGVHRRFYKRFAAFLAESCGFTVLTYDYRGIGGSQPARLRSFGGRIRDWPQLDMPAAIAGLRAEARLDRLCLLGHSAGGNLIGLVPNIALVDAIVLVSAQFGYWRLWPASIRPLMAGLWYIVIPLLSRLFGYVPGWLGAGQHWPSRIAQDLARWCRHPDYLFGDASVDTSLYGTIEAPVLALTFTDDPHATAAASERLLAEFPRAAITRRSIDPRELGVRRIGHFGFFRPFCEPLWRECAQWMISKANRHVVPSGGNRRRPSEDRAEGDSVAACSSVERSRP